MTTDHATKHQLLHQWLQQHWADHSAPLFASLTPDVVLTPDAIQLLQRSVPDAALSLYVVCLGHPRDAGIPVYVGKATVPWERWSRGHLRGLRRAARTGTGTTYLRWLTVFRTQPAPAWLLVLPQPHITTPPYPGFPTQVGAVEYQLVGLLSEVYPTTVLNREGAAR